MLDSVNVKSDIGLPTFAALDPTWTGVYFHALVDSPGVVAANNYLAVFNPSGSGKLAIALGFICGSYSVGAVTTPASMSAFRITASSAGTLLSAANTNRFLTSFPDPVSTVRTANPTVTLLNSTNPMIGIVPTVATTSVGQTVAPTPGASFVFQPGEGIVFATPSGDVDLRWDMQYVWAEKAM